MLNLLKRIAVLLTAIERREMAWLFVAMVLLGVVEFIGVGAILPFMQIVSNAASIHDNQFLSVVFQSLGFENDQAFLLFSGCIVLLLIVFNNGFIAIVNWRIFRFSWLRNASISTRLFSQYMHEEYQFFLAANTSDLEKNLFEEVRMVVVGILTPLLMMSKNTITVFSVIVLLLYIDPLLALSTVICLGGAYGILFTLLSTYLKKIGEERSEANRLRFKIADEALKGIKELHVLGRKRYFITIFEKHSKIMSLSQANKSAVSKLPKHAFEVLAFGGILLIILYYLARGQNLEKIIPILSLYAFAGYRLMPALQTVFTGLSELRYSQAALDNLLHHVTCSDSVNYRVQSKKEEHAASFPVHEITADNLWFHYPGDDHWVLKGINFTIGRQSTIGIIGSTGSGKTTMIDIMLGLLQPQKGELRINGAVLEESNRDSWRANVGYVPQDIYLLDNTIKSNIAYGIPEEEIDMEAVIRSAQLAQIHDTIINECANAYDTIVGERGVKLSGGQRQRIGIARALYHNPDVLIFDEGTSALDNLTENELMVEIQSLSGEKTIIMIAHRLSSLKFCDTVLCFERGEITDVGTYEEISARNSLFLNNISENVRVAG